MGIMHFRTNDGSETLSVSPFVLPLRMNTSNKPNLIIDKDAELVLKYRSLFGTKRFNELSVPILSPRTMGTSMLESYGHHPI